MPDNSKVRTLTDLIQYSESSDYTFPKCITLRNVENIVIHDDIIYDKYRDIIFSNVEIMELDIDSQKRYKYHPARFAMDMYNNPNLAHLILYINGVDELNFKPGNTIKYIPMSAIGDVLKIIMVHETNRTAELKAKAIG